MKAGDYLFFQSIKQSFIKIKSINKGWEDREFVHYYESPILNDLLIDNLDNNDNIKTGYCPLNGFRNYLNENSHYEVFHQIPDSIIEKIKSGNIDEEVKSFRFFSISEENILNRTLIFSKPIMSKKEFRIYQIERALALPD